MHSGDLTELEAANLTDAEREALMEVMQRAKDFDEKAQQPMNGPVEGQIQKWTNALKGWQWRYISVDQQQGVLHYYTSEDRKKHPPRGSLHLWGAVIAPSDEDSQTFSINGMNGEVFKLRASDAKERQQWVSRLRNEVERCTSLNNKTPVRMANTTTTNSTSHTHTTSTSSQPPILSVSSSTTSEKSGLGSPTTSLTGTPNRKLSKRLSVFASRPSVKKRSKERRLDPSGDPEEEGSNLPGGETMLEVLTRLQRYQEAVGVQLESCSRTGVEPVDQNVLLLKATSQAAVHCVRDCLALIKLQQTSRNMPVTTPTEVVKDTEAAALRNEEQPQTHLPTPDTERKNSALGVSLTKSFELPNNLQSVSPSRPIKSGGHP